MLIDWFDASRGDDMADVARLSLLLSPGMPGTEQPRHLPGASADMIDRVRAAYALAISDLHGATPDRLRRWEAVLAVARLAESVPADELLAIWDRWRRPPESVGPSAIHEGADLLEQRRTRRQHQPVVLGTRQLDGGASLVGDQ